MLGIYGERNELYNGTVDFLAGIATAQKRLLQRLHVSSEARTDTPATGKKEIGNDNFTRAIIQCYGIAQLIHQLDIGGGMPYCIIYQFTLDFLGQYSDGIDICSYVIDQYTDAAHGKRRPVVYMPGRAEQPPTAESPSEAVAQDRSCHTQAMFYRMM